MIVERSMDPRWLSNAYLVADRSGGTAVFIDSGAPVEPLLAAVDRLEVHPTHLLTTHAHEDHVANHALLEDRFGLRILASPEEEVEGAEPLGHGEVVEAGDLRIEALRTPGHTRGMLSFVVDGEAVFTGDTLFTGSVGGTQDAFDDLRRSVMDVLMGLPHELDRLSGPQRGDDDRPRVGREPVRPRVARRRAGGRGALSTSAGPRRRSSSGATTTTAAARAGCASATAAT